MLGLRRVGTKRVSVAIAACFSVVAFAITGSADGIVGGALDGERHPNVGLLTGYDKSGDAFYGCSGTLAGPRLFITAAHCTGGQPSLIPKKVRITFASSVPLDSEGVPAPTVYLTGTPIPNLGYSDPEDDLILNVEQMAN